MILVKSQARILAFSKSSYYYLCYYHYHHEMITWNHIASRTQTREQYLLHLELKLFFLYSFYCTGKTWPILAIITLPSARWPQGVLSCFFLGYSDDYPSNQPRRHLWECLGTHCQRGLGEEERPTMNVSRFIPPTGASGWTKGTREKTWTEHRLSCLSASWIQMHCEQLPHTFAAVPSCLHPFLKCEAQ